MDVEGHKGLSQARNPFSDAHKGPSEPSLIHSFSLPIFFSESLSRLVPPPPDIPCTLHFHVPPPHPSLSAGETTGGRDSNPSIKAQSRKSGDSVSLGPSGAWESAHLCSPSSGILSVWVRWTLPAVQVAQLLSPVRALYPRREAVQVCQPSTGQELPQKASKSKGQPVLQGAHTPSWPCSSRGGPPVRAPGTVFLGDVLTYIPIVLTTCPAGTVCSKSCTQISPLNTH